MIIINVEDFERTKKLEYKIWADFSKTIGSLQTSAQITIHYTKESLIDKKVNRTILSLKK
jgi:tRNA-binding protein